MYSDLLEENHVDVACEQEMFAELKIFRRCLRISHSHDGLVILILPSREMQIP